MKALGQGIQLETRVSNGGVDIVRHKAFGGWVGDQPQERQDGREL